MKLVFTQRLPTNIIDREAVKPEKRAEDCHGLAEFSKAAGKRSHALGPYLR
jgi:hypothetical protein